MTAVEFWSVLKIAEKTADFVLVMCLIPTSIFGLIIIGFDLNQIHDYFLVGIFGGGLTISIIYLLITINKYAKLTISKFSKLNFEKAVEIFKKISIKKLKQKLILILADKVETYQQSHNLEAILEKNEVKKVRLYLNQAW